MMRSADQLRNVYGDVTNAYDAWLTSQSPKLANKWRCELANDQGAEGAIFEAWCWSFLRQHVTGIQAGESASNGGADFVCAQGTKYFRAESTCIPMATVKERYWCDDILEDTSTVGSFIGCIQNKVIAKQRQAARSLDEPTIVMVGTLHFTASTDFGPRLAETALTSHSSYRVEISDDPAARKPGYFATDLRHAAFTKLGPDGRTPLPTRQQISAILLCGAGTAPKCQFDDRPPDVVGVLNGDASIPFDRVLLPGIRFFKLDLESQPGRACVVEL